MEIVNEKIIIAKKNGKRMRSSSPKKMGRE
jgi:hypothetical protein